MSSSTSGWHPPRTVVIGAGRAGQHVVEAAHARCIERELAAASVAWLAVVEASADGQADPGRTAVGAASAQARVPPPSATAMPVSTVSLPRGESRWSRRAVRQAALAGGSDVVAGIVAAFAAISRVPPPTPLPLLSRRSSVSSELACYLVAALDDPFGGALVCDLAYLVRYLARQRLNTSVNVTGILLLPDALSLDDPQAAQARTYAALCELESVMSPHDGWRAAWGDGLDIEGMGPVFDKGCFLLGSLNNQGLRLQDDRERIEMAAEALVQLAASPVGARCESPLPPEWNDGERVQIFSSVGVAAWVYPSRALVESSALRMAQVILEAWLKPALPTVKVQASADGAALIESEHLDPTMVDQALMSTHEPVAQGLQRPVAVPLSAKTARTMRSAMDAVLADRLAPLTAAWAEMERRAKALSAKLAAEVAANVDKRLDMAASGRLDEAAAFLDATRLRLQQVLDEMSSRAQDQERTLEETDRELARLGGQLDELGGSFPAPQVLPVLSTLFSPTRLVAAARAMGRLRQLAPAYGAQLTRWATLVFEMVRGELVSSVYEAALGEVANQQRRIDALGLASTAGHKIVSRAGPPLFGGLGFSLEQSVLTPELIDELYRSTQGTIVELLSDLAATPDRLSAWPSVDPDGEDLAGVCLDFAYRRCAKLDQVALEPLILRSIGQTPQRRSEALQALAASASPFLGWDEARLRSSEHQMLYGCVVLGLPQGASTTSSGGLSSPLLDGLGEILWAQAIQSNDRHRVTALCAVHGLPLAALAGLDEYAAAYAAYKVDNLDDLHIFEGWEPRTGIPTDALPEGPDGPSGASLDQADYPGAAPLGAEPRR